MEKTRKTNGSNSKTQDLLLSQSKLRIANIPKRNAAQNHCTDEYHVGRFISPLRSNNRVICSEGLPIKKFTAYKKQNKKSMANKMMTNCGMFFLFAIRPPPDEITEYNHWHFCPVVYRPTDQYSLIRFGSRDTVH